VRILISIDALEDQGVFFLLAQNDTGHTCEYAQHNEVYECFAFHRPKITNNIWSDKTLA
jgi:hypothetical protein